MPGTTSMDMSGMLHRLWKRRHRESALGTLTVILGLALGAALHVREWTGRQLMYIAFPGEILMRMLTMLFLPLELSCVIGAIGSTSYRTGGRLMQWAFVFCVLNVGSAALVGVSMAHLMQPGRQNPPENGDGKFINHSAALTTRVLINIVRDLFPPNIVDVVVHSYPSEAFVRRRARGNATYFDPSDSTRVHTGDRPPHNCTPLAKDGATPHPLKEAKNPKGPSPPNGLGLVAFSVGVGFVLAHSADDRNVLLNFFIGLSNNLMSASRAMMWYAPVGAISLIASRILLASQTADRTQEMFALRPYVVVLLVAVCVHTFLVLPLLQRLVLCRFRDVALFSFYGRIYNALLMSAATASGAATLPVAVYALEQNSGLDARVARFVAPVGVIINRSGMALYLSVSGTFLAQIYKAQLDFWDLSAISMRAAVASMSEPGITRGIKGHIALAGFIMGMHLQEVAILEGGLIFVEWFISLANVCGVCMAAIVCQEIVRKDIGEDDLLADSLEDYSGQEKTRHY